MKSAITLFTLLSGVFFEVFGQANCTSPNRITSLSINNVRASLGLDNSFFNRGTRPGYQVPKVLNTNQEGVHAIFTGSLWLAGFDSLNNQLNGFAKLFDGQQPQGLSSGLLQFDANGLPITNENQCLAWNRHFSVTRQEIEVFKNSWQPGISPTSIPQNVLLWPGRNNPHLILNLAEFTAAGVSIDHTLAPFFDQNNDGFYNPVDGDYPEIKGDESVWWVMNDMGRAKTFSRGNALRNFGFEVQVEAFAISNPAKSYIDNTTFYHFKVFNKSNVHLHQSWLGFFFDGDLGNYNDDYIQSDVMRGMGMLLNGDSLDENINGSFPPYGYGNAIPALGFDFLDGVLADPNDAVDNNRNGIVDEPGERMPMSNFIFFRNDNGPRTGDPASFIEFSNFLQTKWRDGLEAKFNPDGVGNGFRTKFLYPDSSDPHGFSIGGNMQNPMPLPNRWSEFTNTNPPGDRRMVGGMGPFTFKGGSVAEFTMAVIWAYGGSQGSPRASVNKLKIDDDSVQAWFNAGMPFISAINVSNKPQLPHQQIYISPNPASHSVYVQIPEHSGDVLFKIYNHAGQTVYKQKAIGASNLINVSHLPAGIYLFEIHSRNWKKVEKIMIE